MKLSVGGFFSPWFLELLLKLSRLNQCCGIQTDLSNDNFATVCGVVWSTNLSMELCCHCGVITPHLIEVLSIRFSSFLDPSRKIQSILQNPIISAASCNEYRAKWCRSRKFHIKCSQIFDFLVWIPIFCFLVVSFSYFH